MKDKENNLEYITLKMIILMAIGYIIAYTTYVVNKPTAMDVYQGKTTLEYTYRDGVAVDSIVVFKDK